MSLKVNFIISQVLCSSASCKHFSTFYCHASWLHVSSEHTAARLSMSNYVRHFCEKIFTLQVLLAFPNAPLHSHVKYNVTKLPSYFLYVVTTLHSMFSLNVDCMSDVMHSETWRSRQRKEEGGKEGRGGWQFLWGP